MKTQTQIQVRVNEEGALRNQRYAFTDRYTLVTELLQNARRAGATRIDVDYDAATQRLSVTDNGHGIGDFQKLLVFNESGWDDSTQQHEHPFGIGFSKCLYSASRCIIRSGDRFVDFSTADALTKRMIDVHLDTRGHIEGTQVELYDTNLSYLSDHIGPLCAGFPVEVVYNGKPLDHPYAANRLETIRSALGDIHLAGATSGNHTKDTLVFLQGFRVYSPYHYSPARVNVVHLDPERFMARLPDRDKLIDETDQIKLIDAEIRHQWRSILEVAKYQLLPRQFVDRYYDAMWTFGHLDLLNDLDALPRGVCAAIARYPIQQTESEDDHLDHDVEPPDRQDIEDGKAVLIDLDDVTEDNAAHWMYARAKDFLVFKPFRLDSGHWVHAKVRNLSTETLGLEPTGPQIHSRFDGIWVSANLVLCETVRLRIGQDAVDIADNAVLHGGVLFVPANETSGWVVRQISTYVDESEQYRDYELDTDMEALVDLLRRLRSVDPKKTLVSLLETLKLEKYPVLHGMAFRVRVDGQADAHSIELID